MSVGSSTRKKGSRLAVACFSAAWALAGCGGGGGQRAASETVAPAEPNLRNAAISDAASPAEDLIEAALSGNRARAEDRLDRLATAWNSDALPADVRRDAELGRRLAGIRDSVSAQAWSGAALVTVEAYRALVAAQDTAALHVPLPVGLLDYSGFKLAALTSVAPPPDWGAIESAVDEARGTWLQIRDRVRDVALRDLVDSVVAGLERGVAERNTLAVRFGGQVMLDTVDLLEHYFADRSARPTA